ncbi:metalloprotease family protein [uncultured Sphaerotilus sp.]|uniref:metalloprotease family protein n=1 Tax=uncultured Sphaerotilus sp. TaxID=474984 RepID=UPI0030CA36A8
MNPASRQQNNQKARSIVFFIPGSIIAAFTFPGVVIHELAHYLFCRYFKVPVYQVCYFRFGNPAGYVIHQEPGNWLHNVIIAAGPFFLNSALGAIIAFPSALRVFEFDGEAPIVDLILIWLGVSIAMHAIPSTVDAKSMWESVSGRGASWLAKIVVAPVVGLIYMLAYGSIFWLDLVYGIGISLALPKMLVAVFT